MTTGLQRLVRDVARRGAREPSARRGASGPTGADASVLPGGRACPALITGNNATTIATMAALAELGLQVPDDLALAAFDDFPWADCFHPRLTAIRQPLEQLGRRSVELLLDRIATPGRAARSERLTPTLIVRDSCGARPPSPAPGTRRTS